MPRRMNTDAGGVINPKLTTSAALSQRAFEAVSVRDPVPPTWEARARLATKLFYEEPLVSAAINAWIDFALGAEITVRSDNKELQDDVYDAYWRLGLDRVVRDMVQQLLVKGDAVGYLKLGDQDIDRVICCNPISIQFDYDGETMLSAKQNTGAFGGKTIPLDVANLLHLRWNSPEFEQRGSSMILPAMGSLALLLDYRAAERAIAKRWTTPLRFIKIGGQFGTKLINPDQNTLNKFRDEMEHADLQGGLVVPFYVQAETYGTEGKALDTESKVASLKEDVIVALGMSRSLITGDGPNFATASVSMQRMVVQLKAIKAQAMRILDWVFDAWMQQRGIEAKLHYQFDDLDLTSEIDQKRLLIDLYDRGLLSKDTLQQKMGLSPEVENRGVVARAWSTADIATMVDRQVLTPVEARVMLGIDQATQEAEEQAADAAHHHSCTCGDSLMHTDAASDIIETLPKAAQGIYQKELDRLDKALKRASDQVQETLAATKSVEKAAQLQQLQRSIDTIGEELRSVLQDGIDSAVSGEVRNGITAAIADLRAQKAASVVDLTSLTKQSQAVSKVFTSISPATVAFSTSYRMSLMGSVSADLVAAIQTEISAGVLAGIGPRQIAAAIGRYVTDPDQFVKAGGRVFGSVRQRAELIARTETLRCHNAGARDGYRNFGVTQLRWVASASSCPYCSARDGEAYPIAEAETLPAHPACGCTYSAVVDLGLGDENE